jgi:LTXXQ motif family protein
MHPSSRLSLPAFVLTVAMIGFTPIGFTQTAAPTPPTTNGGMMGGGMSGGAMMNGGMGQMMMAMMGDRGGMMADRVESRLEFLKDQLKITEAQMPQWDRFADALRSTATSMTGMQQQMMQGGMPASLPDRLGLHEQMLSAHLERVKDIKAALDPLYAALSGEQKKLADQLIMSPMGMM